MYSTLKVEETRWVVYPGVSFPVECWVPFWHTLYDPWDMVVTFDIVHNLCGILNPRHTRALDVFNIMALNVLQIAISDI